MNQPRDFSLHGAIDLGARQAAAQRRQRAAEQAAAAPGEPGAQATTIEVTDDSFNADVITRSQTVPVVVDLWADWCGPCKQLSPILEKLAAEANGAFLLAKVDADANPQVSAALSQVLQSSSIPMVVAFVGGQIANAFIGALPEAQVRQWLGQLLQFAAQYGVGPAAGAGVNGEAGGVAPGQAGAGPGGGPAGQLAGQGDDAAAAVFAEAQAAIARGDLDAAAAAFEKVLSADPADPAATMGLAQVGLFRRVKSYDQAAVRREAAQRPEDARAQAKMADLDLAAGRTEDAFDRLLATIKRTAGDERNTARQHLVDLFSLFPARDPLVASARSRLSSLLF